MNSKPFKAIIFPLTLWARGLAAMTTPLQAKAQKGVGRRFESSKGSLPSVAKVRPGPFKHLRQWLNGTIRRCQRCGLGSIPGWRMWARSSAWLERWSYMTTF